MFILGSAGVGKTTGVAKLAVSILGENSVSIVAPTKEQVDNLGKNIPNASVKLSKTDIRTQLLGVEN
jgi:signal recognition particle GTPase